MKKHISRIYSYGILICLQFSGCALTKQMRQPETLTFPPTEKVDLLLTKPDKPYVLLTTIESRGDLRSSMRDLFLNMQKKGQEIGADAFIPTKENNDNDSSKPNFELYIVRYQEIDGAKVPVLKGNAIKYKSSIQKLMKDGMLSNFNARAYSLGLQLDLVPYTLKGYHGCLWFGMYSFRMKSVFYKLTPPDFFLAYDYVQESLDFAAGLHVDYSLSPRFIGTYLTTGCEFWNGKLAHKEETNVGQFKSIIYMIGLGYDLNLWKGFYLSSKFCGHFIVAGDAEVKVGNHSARFFRATPYLSVELGWKY